ncbi:Trafficking protein particle complex subunit 1 [Glycine max]|nr:Trafficking protein particle complex subunit 1 [Glycine max]
MQFFGVSEISPSPPAPTASGNNGHMMYVFNRNGVCLLYREWNRPLRTLDAQQDHKLMFGLLFSLKSLTAKMDPTSAVEKGNLGMLQLPGQGCSFHSFCTNTYKLSFMESPSGIKIILVTHPRTGDLRESLKYIYNLYVEYVVKNPLYTPGSPISTLNSAELSKWVGLLGSKGHNILCSTAMLNRLQVRAVQYNVGPVCERHCIDAELFPINTVDDLCGFNALFCMVYVRGIA